MSATPWAWLYLIVAWTLGALLGEARSGSNDLEGGDSAAKAARTLGAEYCYQKALAYFHSGAWYSIFDHEARNAYETTAQFVGENNSLPEEEQWRRESPFAGRELDWLDRFGRNFKPIGHTHLTSGGARGEEGNFAYEMLPWFDLAVRMAPDYELAYEEADYWLRKQLGQPGQAEGFLRRGLVANPKSYRLHFRLGQIAAEQHGDIERARRHWQRAIHYWERQNEQAAEKDMKSFQEIVGHLARMEHDAGQLAEARKWVTRLQGSNNRSESESLKRWLQEIDEAMCHTPPTSYPSQQAMPGRKNG